MKEGRKVPPRKDGAGEDDRGPEGPEHPRSEIRDGGRNASKEGTQRHPESRERGKSPVDGTLNPGWNLGSTRVELM